MKKIKIKISWLLIIPLIILAIIVVGQDNQENAWKKAVENSARFEAEANGRIAEYEKDSAAKDEKIRGLLEKEKKRDGAIKWYQGKAAEYKGQIENLKNTLAAMQAGMDPCAEIKKPTIKNLTKNLNLACGQLKKSSELNLKLEGALNNCNDEKEKIKLNYESCKERFKKQIEIKANDDRVKGEQKRIIEDKKKLVEIADKKIKKLKFQRFLYAVIAAALVFFGK